MVSQYRLFKIAHWILSSLNLCIFCSGADFYVAPGASVIGVGASICQHGPGTHALKPPSTCRLFPHHFFLKKIRLIQVATIYNSHCKSDTFFFLLFSTCFLSFLRNIRISHIFHVFGFSYGMPSPSVFPPDFGIAARRSFVHFAVQRPKIFCNHPKW